KLEIQEKDIQEMFRSGKIPPALVDYMQMLFTEAVNFIEKKEFKWNWDAFWCGLIGLAQIVAGVALGLCTFGLAAPLFQMLISEGIGDMVFAIQGAMEGNFSWKGYYQHKVMSLALSIVTMGVGAYLSKGAQ